jgi:carbon storage regulator
MLVLTRRISETPLIGPDITVAVLDVKGNKVRIGIVAPNEMKVRRQESVDGERERSEHRRDPG